MTRFRRPADYERLSIFSILRPERAKKLSFGVHSFCGKERKSTVSTNQQVFASGIIVCNRRCDLGYDLLAEAANVIDHLLALAHETSDDVCSTEIPKTAEVIGGSCAHVHHMDFEIGSAQSSIFAA